MRKDEYRQGEEWAYRASSSIGSPAARVELLFLPNRKGHVKVKVRHVEGELEGLEEFVNATHLRAKWSDWPKIERDEKKLARFLERMELEEDLEPIVIRAASVVLEASGEDLMLDDWTSYTRFYKSQVAGLDRIADRAGAEGLTRHYAAHKTLDGSLYVPNRVLVELAIQFAQAEPESIHLYLDVEHQEYVTSGYTLGQEYLHKEALKRKPAWAIARQWAAGGEERDHLRDELDRMRRLVHDAIRYLRDAGEDRKAARLERALYP